MTNVGKILDHSTKQGVAIICVRCASLPMKYNLGQAGLVVFVRELQKQAQRQGWHAGTQNITHYLNASLVMAIDPFVLPAGAEYTTSERQDNAQM